MDRWKYLSQFGRQIADRVDQVIEEHLGLLAEQPLMGHPGRFRDTREFAFGKTKIVAVYRVEHDRVWVLRLLHGSQDWPSHLE